MISMLITLLWKKISKGGHHWKRFTALFLVDIKCVHFFVYWPYPRKFSPLLLSGAYLIRAE